MRQAAGSILSGAPETAEERALREWWAAQALASLDNLERAARQIITLCTTLLGSLLALLALAENPLPAYLASWAVRNGAAAAALLLLGGLAAALAVVWPRRYAAAADLPEQQRQAFHAMRRFKARLLTVSLTLFGLGLAALVVVLLLALHLAA